ncbi:MAG TPA: hypothetical protein VJ044_07860, partial [Candidatus Hodarchaeales archaeon]|nr:hypothetical protein [Candidatus Hodarchaeales archaeon]
MRSSDQFIGIMSYSALEACFLSDNGFDNILIAYPVVDQILITECCNRIKKGKKIIFMVDSEAQLSRIDRQARETEITVPVCIDIDLSYRIPGLHFGVLRSPLNSVSAVEGLIDLGKRFQTQFVGIMGYEAQIAGLPDFSPANGLLKNSVIRFLKKHSIRNLKRRREEIVSCVSEQGVSLDFVNGGGTGSVESTEQEDCITEITVGSGFFSPHLFDFYNAFRHLPASGFAVEITRIPKKGIYTCHGGGFIASGLIGIDKQPSPYLPAGAK